MAQKISLLRRISRLDPDNRNWIEDLKAFEKARQAELAREAPDAIRGDALGPLEALAAELESPDWITPPDAGLVSGVRRRITELREALARDRLRAIATRVWSAYSALDYPRTESALGQWRALLAEESVAPPTDVAEQVHEAENWVEAQRNRKDEEAAFRRGLAELEAALDRKAPPEDVERLYYEVARRRHEIPKTLRLRAERAIERARLAEQRVFRLRVVGVIVAVVAVATPIFLFVRYRLYAQRRVHWEREIDAAVANGDYVKAARILGDLRKRRPALAEDPAFRDRAEAIERDSETLKGKRSAFAGAMRQLEAVRDAGFPSGRPTAELEALAERSATAETDRLRLKEWRLARRSHDMQEQAARDGRFSADLKVAMASIAELERLNPETAPARYRDLLDSARNQLHRLRAAAGVSPALHQQASALAQRLARREAHLRETVDKLDRRGKALRAVEGALPDLERCEGLAREFLKTYPGYADAARLRRLVQDCGFGRDLERALKWGPAPDAAMVKTATDFLGSEAARESMWREPLDRLTKEADADRHAPEVRKALAELGENWRLHDVYSAVVTSKETGEPMRLYFRKPFAQQRQWEGDKEVRAYRFTVYGASDREKLMIFPPSVYKVDVKPKLEDNLAPHCRLLRSLIAGADKTPAWRLEALLLRKAEELRADGEIDPVIRVSLLALLLRQVRRLTFENGRLADRALAQIDKLKTNLYWMNPAPDPDTARAKSKYARVLEALNEIPVMAATATARNRIQAACLSRKAKCVGLVRGSGAAAKLDTQGARPLEVWVVEGDSLGRPVVRIVAARGRDGALKRRPGARLDGGQPLFAPTGGKRTSEILKEIAASAPPGRRQALEALSWPRCWPVNGRDLRAAGKE